MTIADAGDSVFVPAIGARAGMVVRKITPRIAIGTVVFAHRSPSTLGQKRSPAVPMPDPLPGHLQPDAFLCVVDIHEGICKGSPKKSLYGVTIGFCHPPGGQTI